MEQCLKSSGGGGFSLRVEASPGGGVFKESSGGGVSRWRCVQVEVCLKSLQVEVCPGGGVFSLRVEVCPGGGVFKESSGGGGFSLRVEVFQVEVCPGGGVFSLRVEACSVCAPFRVFGRSPAVCVLLRPPQHLAEVTAGSRSLGDQPGPPGRPPEVGAHGRRPITGRHRHAALSQ